MAHPNIGPVAVSLERLFAEQDGLKRFLEAVVQQAMSAEVDAHVGAARHERSDGRRGYRNGSKPRTLKTRVGELALALALAVPQVRGCEPYHPGLFNRWQRSERALLVACGLL